MNGMQSYHNGDAAYHREERASFKNGHCERCLKHVSLHDANAIHTCSPTKGWARMEAELAQAKELLANQTAYIKTLQDENLRLNKEVTAKGNFSDTQEALIAELVEALTGFVNYPADDADYPPPYAKAREALEKVVK